MRYITFGKEKNQAVVFLHGWGGNKNSWGNIPKVLAGFGFFTVVVDFPGFGESDVPSFPYEVKDFAGEIVGLINDLNLVSPIIVGHSFGGRVGIKIAGRKLTEIKKLVLVDSAGLVTRKSLAQKLKVLRFKRLKQKVQKGKLPAEVLNKFGSSDYKAQTGVMREVFVKVVNEDLTEDAKQIDVETLLVWGKKDKDTPIKLAKKFKRLIKGSRLVVYDAGHFSYLEYQNKFVDELYEFMLN